MLIAFLCAPGPTYVIPSSMIGSFRTAALMPLAGTLTRDSTIAGRSLHIADLRVVRT